MRKCLVLSVMLAMVTIALSASAKSYDELVDSQVLDGDKCFMFPPGAGRRVIRSQKELATLFDPKYQRAICPMASSLVPKVDFAKKTVLAFWAGGSCAATDFHREVIHDRARNTYTYYVKVNEGDFACSGPGLESMNLVAIPKVPVGTEIKFELAGEGGGSGGVTITSVSQTPTYMGPPVVTVITDPPPPSQQDPPSNPFLNAIRDGNSKKVLAELANGVDVNQKDPGGATPLMYAVMYENVKADIVNGLLAHGADPNVQSKYGMTALMFAVENVDLETIKTLLKSGANVDLKNGRGATALNFARRPAVAILLREAGAK